MQSTRSKKQFQLFIKRLFDIIFSLIALIPSSIVFLIVAIMIIKEDGLPVFFKQKRSGKDGKTFLMYKFRSMKVQKASETSVSKPSPYNWTDGVPDDFVFKSATSANPNVTRTGAFIRKYSLDELPQFINVLKGEMSIVGPRPEIIEITKCYNAEQRRRLLVKPGITGLAQANGRSNMDHGEKMKWDLRYVNHFSIWLDFKILLKTVGQVFTGKGSF